MRLSISLWCPSVPTSASISPSFISIFIRQYTLLEDVSVRPFVHLSVRYAFFSDEPMIENEVEGYQRQHGGQRPGGEQHLIMYTNLFSGQTDRRSYGLTDRWTCGQADDYRDGDMHLKIAQ